MTIRLLVGLVLIVVGAGFAIHAAYHWRDGEPTQLAMIRLLFPHAYISYEHGPETKAKWGYEWYLQVNVAEGVWSFSTTADSLEMAASLWLANFQQRLAENRVIPVVTK